MWLYYFILCCTMTTAEPVSWDKMAAPEVGPVWVRPAEKGPAQPVWGHANGLRVGLAPMPGPRGLLRIYAPYLGQPDGQMINFIAVEPIVEGQNHRGYSELEQSEFDHRQGKRFWSADAPDNFSPRPPEQPARGVVASEKGVEMLEVYILIEPYKNGARPYLKLQFRADRPYEVGLTSFAQPDSKPMHSCVLTATMGNYARLRRLHLADDKTVLSTDLWPKYDGNGFSTAKRFPLEPLPRTSAEHVTVEATTDEENPEKVEYAPFTFHGWKYQGRKAVQYWRCEKPSKELCVQVNGRTTYWASRSRIPGGIAFENFEMIEPFRKGQTFWFGVRPEESQN